MNNYINFTPACTYMLIPVAVPSKARDWQFRCWDCGFESRRWHKCLSFVSVVLSGRGLWDELSLVWKSPIDCSASLCVI